MKRKLTFLAITVLFLISGNIMAQDTISGWIFPEGSADEYPDIAISINANRFLSCEYGTSGTPTYFELEIDYTTTGIDGGTDKCAKTTGWNDGADSICWIVKFRTPGYKNIKVYSKQKSETETPGPRDFILQYKLSGSSPWNDLATIECTDSWNDGTVEGVLLPEECEDVDKNISLRWLVKSNTDINGNTIQANGSSLIDNIIITGEAITGIGEIANSVEPFVFPNPSAGTFVVRNLENISGIKVFDTKGRLLEEIKNSLENEITIEGLLPGVYFINCYDKNGQVRSIKTVVN
ncbi:MAG TPA: T9SS type A sorting domain-containing protein [Bacteroidales bacterium]|nr:T9SS type A sorting domain-containing protein [Bacteroidales bacterium]